MKWQQHVDASCRSTNGKIISWFFSSAEMGWPFDLAQLLSTFLPNKVWKLHSKNTVLVLIRPTTLNNDEICLFYLMMLQNGIIKQQFNATFEWELWWKTKSGWNVCCAIQGCDVMTKWAVIYYQNMRTSLHRLFGHCFNCHWSCSPLRFSHISFYISN